MVVTGSPEQNGYGSVKDIVLFTSVLAICLITVFAVCGGIALVWDAKPSNMTLIDFGALHIGVFFGMAFVMMIQEISSKRKMNKGTLFPSGLGTGRIIARYILLLLTVISGIIGFCLLGLTGYFFYNGKPHWATVLVDAIRTYFINDV